MSNTLTPIYLDRKGRIVDQLGRPLVLPAFTVGDPVTSINGASGTLIFAEDATYPIDIVESPSKTFTFADTGLYSISASTGITLGGTSRARSIANAGVLSANVQVSGGTEKYAAKTGALTLREGSGITITNPGSGNVLQIAGDATPDSGITTTIAPQNSDGSAAATAKSGAVLIREGTGIAFAEIGGGANGFTVANDGVTSVVAGTGISLSAATGAVTITNTVSSGAVVYGPYNLDTLFPVKRNNGTGTSHTVLTGSNVPRVTMIKIGRLVVANFSWGAWPVGGPEPTTITLTGDDTFLGIDMDAMYAGGAYTYTGGVSFYADSTDAASNTVAAVMAVHDPADNPVTCYAKLSEGADGRMSAVFMGQTSNSPAEFGNGEWDFHGRFFHKPQANFTLSWFTPS
jgi:hypothetical protein